MVDDIIDEVAISRALEGDASVWPHLTKLERDEAILRAAQRRRREQAENAEWTPIMRLVGRTAKYSAGAPSVLPHSYVSPVWLEDVARAAGFRKGAYLMDVADRIERRRSGG